MDQVLPDNLYCWASSVRLTADTGRALSELTRLAASRIQRIALWRVLHGDLDEYADSASTDRSPATAATSS